MSLIDAIAARAAAGRAYSDAAKAFMDAWVELHALDMALTNRTGDRRGFGGPPPSIPGHPQFLPDIGKVMHDPAGRAQRRLQSIVAKL